MTKTRKIAYGAVLAVVAVLFVLGGLYDMDISNAVYSPENFAARLFESIGIFPPFVIVGATFSTLFFLLNEEKKAYLLKRIACVAAVAVAYFVFGFMAINETGASETWVALVVGGGTALCLTPINLWLMSRVKKEILRKLFVFLLFGTIVCVLADILIVNVLKYIWGRPRYREMLTDGDFSIFSAWYHINGLSLHGHHSFPSGHTASASAFFVLCGLTEVFPEYKKKESFLAFVAAFYTFTMAYSRIVVGAHFLSDVTAGFLIGFVTYAVTRFIYFRHFGVPSKEAESVKEEPVLTESAETPAQASQEGAEEAETLSPKENVSPLEKEEEA